jgi:DNA-directed RNA polymerase subunit RPC12/RpoP
MESEELIKQNFEIKCKACGSSDVEVTYSAGREEWQVCYTGYLEFKCKNCGKEILLDE